MYLIWDFFLYFLQFFFLIIPLFTSEFWVFVFSAFFLSKIKRARSGASQARWNKQFSGLFIRSWSHYIATLMFKYRPTLNSFCLWYLDLGRFVGSSKRYIRCIIPCVYVSLHFREDIMKMIYLLTVRI